MRKKLSHPQWSKLNHERKKDFENFILDITNPYSGVRMRVNIQNIGRKYNLHRYRELSNVYKDGDKIFCPHNSSRPTLLKYLEIAYNQYISFDHKSKTKKVEKQKIQDLIKPVQQQLTFDSDVKIQYIDLKTAKEALRQVLPEVLRQVLADAGITKQFQLVNRFIRDWNEDNKTVN